MPSSPPQMQRIRQQIKLSLLRALIAVDDAGSIRGAARALGLTQPALTKNIAQLEAMVGSPVVRRGSAGTGLTDVGRALLGHARAIETELRRAEEHVAQLTGQFVGQVTLGVSPSPALSLVPHVLRKFRQRYPDVLLCLVEGFFHTHIPLVREGAMDLAGTNMSSSTEGYADMAMKAISQAELFVCARRTHRLHGKVHRLADLAQEDWVNVAPPGSAMSSVEQVFVERGLSRPRIAVQCNSVLSVSAVLASTELLGMLPEPMFRAWATTQLRALEIADRIDPVPIVLVQRKAAPLTPAASALATMLEDEGAAARR